ncbi:MAG: hypothetical protein JW959_04785 [Pirellulales bacterium]|nr:hypothetical protein [Pirellulales bacterium]
MKVKVKLDLKTIQKMLLQNVEKIGLGGVVLIFIFMIYSAFTSSSVERFQQTPQELIQLADEKKRAIDGDKELPEPDLKIQDYAALTQQLRTPIEEKHYATPVVWDPPLFPKKPLRDTPPLLAAQQLRGSADVGAVQMKAEVQEEKAGAEMMMGTKQTTTEVRGQRWIVVTALVPYEKQLSNYFEALGPCKGYNATKDVPVYAGYWIERVELANPSEAANIDWSKAKAIPSGPAMDDARSKWASQSNTNVVDQKYFDSKRRLVFPLPPLVGKQWDEGVAHPEEVPLASAASRGRGMGMGQLDGELPRHGMGPEGYGPRGESDLGDPFAPEKKPEDNTNEAEKIAQQNKPPAHRLLRFFDFDIEPGKHYVYRVRLLLDNPNYGTELDKSWLADPKLAEIKWLETKWSDPTSVITVPHDTRVLAVSVAPGQANRDPSGEVMAVKWVQRRGFLAHDKFHVERGQLIHFPDRKFTRVQGRNRLPGAMEGMAPEGPGLGSLEGAPTDKRDKRKKNRPPAPDEFYGEGLAPTATTSGDEWLVNYYSGAIALDFRGAENLSGRRGSGLKSIGEILLLDAEGNLVVRNELEDQAERDKIVAASEIPPVGGAFEGGIPNMPNPHGALDEMFSPGPQRENRRRR